VGRGASVGSAMVNSILRPRSTRAPAGRPRHSGDERSWLEPAKILARLARRGECDREVTGPVVRLAAV
jgi:hypothetical protein